MSCSSQTSDTVYNYGSVGESTNKIKTEHSVCNCQLVPCVEMCSVLLLYHERLFCFFFGILITITMHTDRGAKISYNHKYIKQKVSYACICVDEIVTFRDGN